MIKRGVDVVVMVENTREISLEDFFESMDKDERMGGWNEGDTSEDI